MALINCPECNQEVSSLASECPKCAYPIAGGGSTQASGGKIQTVEQTGKKYKLHQMLSLLLFFVGMIITVAGGGPFGGFMCGIGIIWFCTTRFMSWWHHA